MFAGSVLSRLVQLSTPLTRAVTLAFRAREEPVAEPSRSPRGLLGRDGNGRGQAVTRRHDYAAPVTSRADRDVHRVRFLIPM
jgi:hypothetical protein